MLGYLPTCVLDWLLQVEGRTETTVMLRAGNDAVLDGLLTVMICHRCAAAAVAAGLRARHVPRLQVSRHHLTVAACSCCPLPWPCREDEEFGDDFGLPVLSESDMEALKFLG